MTRQVIKLGSSSIASRDGLALDVIAGLVSQIAAAQRAGHEIILVTSGAARLGRRLLAFEGPTAGAAPALQALIGSVRSSVHAAPAGSGGRGGSDDAAAGYDRLVASLQEILRQYDSPEAGQCRPPQQAVDTAMPAAVGQPALMALYRQLAAAVGVEVGQILISRSDLASPRAMGDLGQLLREAVGRGLLPVVNGNDATDPLSALDNDQVAVAVAVAAEASRLLFLTDVRAAYRDSSLSDRITRLTPAEARAVRVSAGGTGRGGMGSKLGAAARAACCGVECVIGSAEERDIVARSLNPRARVGTVIRGVGTRLEPSRRWIGGIAYSEGSVHVNREAEVSLRTGSTLFLSGVKRVDGEFAAGSVVELVDVRHPERLIGRGSVALPASILRLLRALSPQQVACAISILLRLRYSGTALLGEPEGRGAAWGEERRRRRATEERATREGGASSAPRRRAGNTAARTGGSPASLLDPDVYKDCRELAEGASRASQEAFAQLTAFSADRVADLADSLLLAQPALCTTFLLSRGFLHGQVPTEPAARRVVRGIHAVHRESLVVYSG
ncbi:MAG TPA: PUA domain-containing protein [Streptosporangiaceae bacterium]|nr:PUA domain-containing protein [Streptosporangiaceae bacterium]